MKKKMLIAIIIFTVVILLLAAVTYLGIGPVLPFMKVEKAELNPAGELVSEEAPLMALIQTQEEAEKLVVQYGIGLVSCEDGIVLYQTEEDPYAVITCRFHDHHRSRQQGHYHIFKYSVFYLHHYSESANPLIESSVFL